jgi:hypothetical protein
MRFLVLLGGIAIAATVACGPSPEEKRAQEIQQGAEAMAKGFEDMARGIGAMAGGTSDQKPVDPVSFRDLQTVFGDLAGWEMGKPTGESMTMPVNYSQAKVSYTRGDAEIEVQVSDSAFNQMLLVPYSMFLASGYEKETSEGYEKSTKVGDYPGWEKWNIEDKDGELNVVVNKRFIVQVSGRRLDDAATLHTAIASVDLNKLAALK